MVARTILSVGTLTCEIPSNILGFVIQLLGNLVSLQFADSLDVVTKQQAVLLVAYVSRLSQILIDDGVRLA